MRLTGTDDAGDFSVHSIGVFGAICGCGAGFSNDRRFDHAVY
jgi:hypothetical protein